jgi:hypothetical protein
LIEIAKSATGIVSHGAGMDKRAAATIVTESLAEQHPPQGRVAILQSLPSLVMRFAVALGTAELPLDNEMDMRYTERAYEIDTITSFS